MSKWLDRLKHKNQPGILPCDNSDKTDKSPPSVSFVPFVSEGTMPPDITGKIIMQVFADYEDETKFEIPW